MSVNSIILVQTKRPRLVPKTIKILNVRKSQSYVSTNDLNEESVYHVISRSCQIDLVLIRYI